MESELKRFIKSILVIVDGHPDKQDKTKKLVAEYLTHSINFRDFKDAVIIVIASAIAGTLGEIKKLRDDKDEGFEGESLYLAYLDVIKYQTHVEDAVAEWETTPWLMDLVFKYKEKEISPKRRAALKVPRLLKDLREVRK